MSAAPASFAEVDQPPTGGAFEMVGSVIRLFPA